ncbi:hypothetical protein SERLADRAFT_414152 [Serpula lacrymans var. lacrymans S7.9]|uniref:non-specific serine/threonine protein kinase n=1 Tax=Serpula lacrymans var. lacrymans (strain S7.9) TaxID=578457 RepID=F8NMV8_SERL9|nr:uncharacterized protein SERLADRAFT_414152 [Serpula lacrymans var. lacrymans S7.9]EGO27933.1 hypothetical protein SERLADRAFT_414152 [Serpula lacrymans var. lacrymans S7.9]
MSLPVSTQFIVPATFQSTTEGEVAPKHFLEFLNSLIAGELSEDFISVVPSSHKETWTAVLSGLSDVILGLFPYARPALWESIHERLVLTDISLDVIQRATDRIDSLYVGLEDITKKFFVQLLGLCHSSESWLDVQVPEKEGIPIPSTLHSKAIQGMIVFLRSLGGSVKTTEGSGKPPWKVLRDVISESLDICDVFLSVIVEILSRVLSPPLLSQWFMMDLLRRTVVLAQSAFNYCLCCPTTPHRRSRSLARIIESSHVLLAQSPSFEVSLDGLPCRLLLCVLEEGPNSAWESSYAALRSTFAACKGLKTSHNASAVLSILRSEHWGDPGFELRFLGSEYIRIRLPSFDPATLSMARDFFEGNNDYDNKSALIREIDKALQAPSNLSAKPDIADQNAISLWRRNVRETVEELIVPDDLHWMDVDEDSPAVLYAQRAADEIQKRFDGPLHMTAGPARLSLAEKICDFPALLSQNEGTYGPPLSTLPCFMPILTRLLDGLEEEITGLVRRRVFLALAQVIKYHSPKSEMVSMTSALEMIYHGLAEKDRYVRLSAGLLDAPKDSVKETMLISVGFIGRSTKAEGLEQAVCCLISQLAKQNPLLRGVAYLQGPGQPSKALNFILKILSDAVVNLNIDSSSIDVQSLVGSCRLPLLTELVIVLGDENEENSAAAVQALKRVERSLSKSSRPERASAVSTLAPFLKDHMLGIISDMNDTLQDVLGKKSISEKRQILRSIGALIGHIGPAINSVSPQIMAMLQTMFLIPELSEVTLATWFTFLSTLEPNEVGPHVGPTSASFISSWSTLSPSGRDLARKSLHYIIFDVGERSGKHLDDIVDLRAIPELYELHEKLQDSRKSWQPKYRLQKILDRSGSDNLTVALQSLGELKSFMLNERPFVQSLASACHDGDGTENSQLLAFECIGILGAVDPDRCEIGLSDTRMVVRSNFTDEGEAVLFALHIIKDVLVGAFRSTSDIQYQNHLAYAIQELLRFCKFTPALVTSGTTTSVPMKVRNRWNSLPKHVLETVTPLLESRYSVRLKDSEEPKRPIYPSPRLPTYREWIQKWTEHLLTRASGNTAQKIFSVLRSAVRNKDVGVAHHLLPHLVLNILLSGSEEDKQDILSELLAVLEDQVASDSCSSPDKKLLSAQAVFMLLDHLSKYVRILRQDISSKKVDSKRVRTQHVMVEGEEQLVQVDSMLSSINHDLMAKAALQCKAYARSLMNFERQIIAMRERQTPSRKNQITPYYERLHEIYANLNEPDGMEGVSTLILSPSLEHQIRQHESTGRWTSAQSCWEVRLQQSPDNLDFHLGLLRCLRNLGHYDSLRTHVQGVLTRNPAWESDLAGFQAESAWMIGAWDDVEKMVENTGNQTPSIVKARVLLSMRTGDTIAISNSLSQARVVLGTPITASGEQGYRRSYDAVLDLHLIHELEMIHAAMEKLPANSQERRSVVQSLGQSLATRFNFTLPNFRIRESVLSMRRTAFSLSTSPRNAFTPEIGRSWLASAKIARKAGQWHTAYSAMLQAQQSKVDFSFMESAKLVKATGEPLRALQELENSMRLVGIIEDKSDTIDLTEDDDDTKRMKAKNAADLWPKWESGFYHLGQFHDQCYRNLSTQDQEKRGIKMNLHTVRNFAKAVVYGSKYVYQTVPRLLTLWLDMGEHPKILKTDVFGKVNATVSSAIKTIPVYKWFTAFPQIVSRVGHTNTDVYAVLSKLIALVIQEYPNQALWLFTSVVKSTKPNREQRGKAILDQLKSNPANTKNQVPVLITQCVTMTDELLRLCNHHIDDDRKTVSMKKEFPRLAALGRSPLLIPLQESLTANLPPTSSTSHSTHNPFPPAAPTFDEFFDEIEIMRSLAKPRKITIRGSNGQIYMFLGKPKDDLRKDARLMDFNAILNKLLKANSESRRRQLHIRTYGVVTLNEECGFIQWVPNTIPVRPVLVKFYDAKRIKSWNGELSDTFKKIKEAPEKDAANLFITKVLPEFPPVFHEWFIETFPEPTAWLASRLSYGRTAAVMSMVGFILGLGDRHCENILLDTNTGDAVHVDFNCLFEKVGNEMKFWFILNSTFCQGKTLETPERVPFRLTQNMIDGLGVTGVEGVFRKACEVTLQLLRDNKDSLMSVLDAFIHDPLVEWEDEKRKMERDRRNAVKSTTDLRHLAKNALNPIEKKLKGIYSTSKERHEKEISTSNLVQMLIQEATDSANLAKMYPGWAAWH